MQPKCVRADEGRPARLSDTQEIAAFMARATGRSAARGRLIFALDATMSRQPTWDLACHLQAEMFDAVRGVGGLSVRLAYFRGHREARATRWLDDPAALAALMAWIGCAGGQTQIGRLLALVEAEAGKGPAPTLVYVGDCMEEDADALCTRAGRLALHGVRAFMFHEGRDPVAARTFREIARITGGVYRRFDTGAADALRNLLAAAALYAVGGRAALEAAQNRDIRALLSELR